MAKKQESKKANSDPGTDRIVRSVVMPPDLDARLNAFCEKEERSMSFVIAKAVREFLDKAGQK